MHLPKRIHYLIPFLLLCICFNNARSQSALITQEQRRLPFIKDSISRINSLNRIGILYHLKNPDSCFYYGMKAKTIAIRLHYTRGATDANNVIAIALFLKGLSRESLQLFGKVLHDYRQESDTANVAQVLMNMATVYANIADSSQAKILSRQAIRTGDKLKQDSVMSLVYASYCMINAALSGDSVRYYLDKSQEIALRYKDRRMLIAILQIQASELLGKNRKQDAFPLIAMSLSEARKAGMEYLEANSLELYAAYYADKPDSVRIYYNHIYQLVQKKGYIFLKVPVLKVVLSYAEMAGNKDTIISIHHLMEAALAAENENQKKFIGDYIKYNVIQDDNTLLETNNKNSKIEIWLLITVCLVSILLIIFIYRLYRVSRNLNDQISEQNSHMQKTLNDLEQSQADNTRMMQIVAHDLRNPIGGITSIAALMLDEHDRPTEDRMMLELIKTSGQNSLELVSDLLQVHIGAEEMKKEPVDLGAMLRYCVDLLQHKADTKGQHIVLQTAPVTLSINREKIWRMVSNLIANAIKFSPSGAYISVLLEEKPQAVMIEVEDHGIGIPVEMKDKIFDMFTKAKRTGTAGEQPFGLGLAISKQIVEAHGGKIWFESKPGNGTTFFVELPVA